MFVDLKSTQLLYESMIRNSLLDGHFGPHYSGNMFAWALDWILAGLDFHPITRQMLTKPVAGIIRAEPQEAVAAQTLHQLLLKHGLTDERLAHCLKAGNAISVNALLPHMQTQTLLDYGSGDGRIAFEINKARGHKKVQLYDISDYRHPDVRAAKHIHFTNKWEEIAALDPFGTAIAVTVLHHCEDPETELAKMATVARRIVLIESIISPHIPIQIQAFTDWWWNRVLFPHARIPVPGNWKTTYQLRQLFRTLGLTVIYEKDLGSNQPTDPQHHWLWVLQTSF
jgi:hypothetical protein